MKGTLLFNALREAIDEEMARDPLVCVMGEDVGQYGGSYKVTKDLYEKYGEFRVLDTPIAENSFTGMAVGAAMTGLRPIAEIMFSDFLAVCWDIVANQIAKTRYMSDGQINIPLVIRTANGGGSKFGAQHSQSLENWSMMIPGLKVVAPSCPSDVLGLMDSAVKDPDPVIFYEHKSLYAFKEEIEQTDLSIPIGEANTLHEGKDITIIGLALMAQRAKDAALILKDKHDINAKVIDLRSLVPLDLQTIKKSVIEN